MPRAPFRVAVRSWRGLAAIAVWAVPIFVWGQGAPLPLPTRSTADLPFAGVDYSLSRAADAVLASAAQTPTPAAGTDKKTSAGLTVVYGPRLTPWKGSAGLAAARVELLRPVVEPILRSHGVPADLVAVMVVESGGSALALSPKGARGPWQLMPDTARRYGLRVDQIQDDRVDLFRATDAAAQYLHDLYGQFGDWRLALAAYNTGEINVLSAIQKAGSQDFDQLANMRILPLETRNYVPRVLATAQNIGQLSALGEGGRPATATAVFAVSSRQRLFK